MTRFQYKNYHFEPYGKLPDEMNFSQLSKRLRSDKSLNLRNYKEGNGWNYGDFYRESPDKKADLFRCIENGQIYIPAENELFLFIG